MFKTSLKANLRILGSKKAMCLAAVAFFFLISIIPAQGQTNLVSGTAFGTNYVDLATTNSITSREDGDGTLFVAYSNTTELTLKHDISGFIVIDNAAADFTLSTTSDAEVTSTFGPALTVFNATNLTLTGGRYIGADNSGSGGRLVDSTASLDGSEFTGGAGRAGMVLQASELEITAGTFIGGQRAMGLFAGSNSTVIVNSGSFTGGVGNTAFYLQDSDVTVIDGSFVGNVSGTDPVFGDGLYSELTTASTNKVELQGGTFSSVAFWGVDGSLHDFLAGTNLVIQNGIVQNGGLVVVDNQSNDPLQDLWIRRGTMEFQNAFTLSSNGVLNLSSEDSFVRFSSNFIADSGAVVFNDLGRIDVGGNFTLDSGAVVSNGLGRIEVTGGFTQASDSLLFFAIDSETNGMLSADTAAFETNATINVDAIHAGFNAGTNNILLVMTTNGITLNTTNLTASTSGRVLLSDIYVTPGGSNLNFEFTTQALKDYWNATGVFGEFSEELDLLATTEMYEIIDLINDPEISSRAVEQTYFTTFNTFQTAVNGIRAAVGQSVARGAQLRDQKRMVPSGARGPRRRRSQLPESQIRGWGKYYGNYYTRSESGFYPSYETGLNGVVLGVDASINKLIVGISGGAGRYETTFNNDAREDTTASYGSLYATYGAERGYIDAGIAYGINQVETQTAEPFRLDGDFDAQVANAYLGGGIDLIDTRGGTVFTPEASIQYAKYKQDGYTETGTAAVPRVFDGFDADSLLSSIGINVAMQERKAMKTVAFQLDGGLHWMHEFNADPSDINFMLAGGSNQYLLTYPALDEEIYRIGIGCSFFNTGRRKPKNVVFRVDFEELFGDGFNSHNLSAKVVYAF